MSSVYFVSVFFSLRIRFISCVSRISLFIPFFRVCFQDFAVSSVYVVSVSRISLIILFLCRVSFVSVFSVFLRIVIIAE